MWNLVLPKKLFISIGLILATCCVQAQKSAAAIDLILRLDSVSNSRSLSSHFATIYLETTIGAVNYFSQKNVRAQCLIERLETRFAGYFFKSANAYRDQQKIDEVWKAYYSDSTAPALRYVLYGINAHINGDIWQALTSEFSAEEIAELKPYYISYQKELTRNYNDYFQDALATNSKMKTLHVASFGLDKMYGKLMLKRWRKRQLRLAELFFSNPVAFEKSKQKLHRKMNKLNLLIEKNI